MNLLEQYLADNLNLARRNRQSSAVVETVLAIKEYVVINPAHTLSEDVVKYISHEQFDEA
ncbi:hypothetical protein OTK49_03425 [Vibrio coralliirubri]|uniref:hypothetical protein n=1 Tax=Vibrio coralliirubri TaxID=1516159 RepID=UPI002283396A|nr:hypothetical protein [Vibrio coralliirubri]MCY9861568.1 hypothetical protein [Vibrio coralliirubri]